MLQLLGQTQLRMRAWSLSGVPEGLETEAIAWLDDDRVALGTESNERNRTSDRILIAERDGVGFSVTDEIILAYPFGFRCKSNEGIEGLCQADGQLTAAGEVVMEYQGRRMSPLAFYDMTSQAWSSGKVWLTSSNGKISGLACRTKGDHLEFLAIERDFGVLKVLWWNAPRGAAPREVHPQVLYDLSVGLDVNVEGITWTNDGAIALVSDNHFHGHDTGVGQLIVLPVDSHAADSR